MRSTKGRTNKIVQIMKENWDFLIVLDACRYDFFSEIYSEYFSGVLHKKISVGSCTAEWCKKSFTKYYDDVIYVSGNPHINSKIKVGGFNGKKHFYQIVDVWKYGWNEEIGTVLPYKINEYVYKFLKYHPDKRFIIHYLQPHAPYISDKIRARGYETPFSIISFRGFIGNKRKKFFNILLNKVDSLLFEANITDHTYKLREMFKLPPADPMDAVRRKIGRSGLINAYLDNLKVVLSYVNDLVRKISKKYPFRKIIITSDHGEFLGEEGRYGHPYGSRDRLLLEIPWFEVTTAKKISNKFLYMTTCQASYSEKQKLKNKIKKMKQKLKFKVLI